MKELDIINDGNCISASRHDRIIPGNHWIGSSIDKNGVYPTTQLLYGVARVSIKNEGTRKINYGKCIAASRPDRITPNTLLILTYLLTPWLYSPCRALASRTILYGYEARMMRMQCTAPHLLNGVARVSIRNEGTRHH
jgi:hypothetical protein